MEKYVYSRVVHQVRDIFNNNMPVVGAK